VLSNSGAQHGLNGSARSGQLATRVRKDGAQDIIRGFELSAGPAAALQLFVGRRVGNAEDAEDIAQQALLLGWSELHGFRGANPQPWLLAIARNLITDHYRAQNRYQLLELTESLAQIEPALQSRPDAALAARDCHEQLDALLDRISDVCLAHQVPVLLADVYGHSDRHSAAVLRMSVPSFKLLLHGARTRLRAIAGRSCSANGRTGTSVRNGGTRHLGVICPLDTPELLALRSQLLEGLEH
jgi:DNA-directed RNA polymerase specialized sigma24 family protein